MTDPAEAARRIVAEYTRKDGPMATARVIQLPDDAFTVARAYLALLAKQPTEQVQKAMRGELGTHPSVANIAEQNERDDGSVVLRD